MEWSKQELMELIELYGIELAPEDAEDHQIMCNGNWVELEVYEKGNQLDSLGADSFISVQLGLEYERTGNIKVATEKMHNIMVDYQNLYDWDREQLSLRGNFESMWESNRLEGTYELNTYNTYGERRECA